MKTILLFIINSYQVFFSVILRNVLGIRSFCRFSPTCSSYAKQVIREKGAFKGTILALARLSKCQPISRINYDRTF